MAYFVDKNDLGISANRLEPPFSSKELLQCEWSLDLVQVFQRALLNISRFQSIEPLDNIQQING
jgi:hypothetical protein